jgi:hypothetical protein
MGRTRWQVGARLLNSPLERGLRKKPRLGCIATNLLNVQSVDILISVIIVFLLISIVIKVKIYIYFLERLYYFKDPETKTSSSKEHIDCFAACFRSC